MTALCSLDYENVSCSFSEDLLSKANEKCHISMLTLLVKIHFKIISAKVITLHTSFRYHKRFKNISNKFMKSLSEISIRNLKKMFSLVFTIVNRGSYMNLLSIAYKKNKWCYSMVRIGSPSLISFY